MGYFASHGGFWLVLPPFKPNLLTPAPSLPCPTFLPPLCWTCLLWQLLCQCYQKAMPFLLMCWALHCHKALQLCTGETCILSVQALETTSDAAKQTLICTELNVNVFLVSSAYMPRTIIYSRQKFSLYSYSGLAIY